MRERSMLRVLTAVGFVTAFASVANGLLCGYTTTNVPVYSFGRIVKSLDRGTAVSFSDKLNQGGGNLGDTSCYVALSSPVNGDVIIHSSKCHHPSLFDYPKEKVPVRAPAPAPEVAGPAPSSPGPAVVGPSASPARKLLQEGDGLVEDDVWFIRVTGEC